MPRPSFDPDRAAGGLPAAGERAELGPAGREGRRTINADHTGQLTVSQATELIKTTLEQRIASPLRVIGEVSNLSVKGHWYFSLKDESAVLCCAAWATAVRKFGFTPRDGDEVIATGHISHYGPQGRTQLYVSELVPVGAGALELRFRALCQELRELGYFDDARKKLLPIFPRRIAVITSATGAAIADVVNTAAQRCKAIALLLIDVRVQGEGAAEQIAHAIKWIDRHRVRLGVDAILVTRGGGSIEDLWAFNERIVADAVFQCHLPVVAAIGHESDTTVIELVADVRASTPTQAAMRLIPSSEELCRQINHLAHRLGLMLSRIIERQRQRIDQATRPLRHGVMMRVAGDRTRLERLANGLEKLQPRRQVAHGQARLAVLRDRLGRAIRIRIDQRQRVVRLQLALGRSMGRHLRRGRERLTGLERHLKAVDPQRVLHRGYSLTMHRDGRLIRSAGHVSAAQQIVTRLAEGSIRSIVSSAKVESNAQPARRHRNKTTKADQMDLFSSSM